MSSDNSLVVWAVIAVIISAVALFVTYSQIAKQEVLLAPQGTAQVEITSLASLDFTYTLIDWGAGYVNASRLTAVLITKNATQSGFLGAGVKNASGGFVMENTGNQDLWIDYNISKTMDQWLPKGSGQSAALRAYTEDCVNVISANGYSNATCNYASRVKGLPGGADTAVACANNCGVDNTWVTMGTRIPICDGMHFEPIQNEMRIDLELTLPVTLPPTAGPQTNTFQAYFGAPAGGHCL